MRRLLSMLLGVAACGPTPAEVMVELVQGLERGPPAELTPLLAADYADPLGDRARLLEDLAELAERFPRRKLLAAAPQVIAGASRLQATWTADLTVELEGDTRLYFLGPAQVELVREGRFRAASGVLSDLRDIDRLLAARKAALEANDAAAYAALLHPGYRDGDLDREDAQRRLEQDLSGVAIRLRPSLHKVEVRGPEAHVDEHYVLVIGGEELPPRVARFTLRRAGGRWRFAAGLFSPPDRR